MSVPPKKITEQIYYEKLRLFYDLGQKAFLKDRDAKAFHASEAGQCPRHIYYSHIFGGRLGEEKEKSLPSIARLLEGDNHHQQIYKVLRSVNPSLKKEFKVGKKIKRDQLTIEIRGTIDCYDKDRNLPYEFKSADDNNFKEYTINGLSDIYLAQTMTYLGLTGAREGVLIMKNINTGMVHFFTIKFDEELWNLIKTKFFRVAFMIQKGEAPERQAGGECIFCNFADDCWGVDKTDEGALAVADPLIKEYLNAQDQFASWEAAMERLKNQMRIFLAERRLKSIKHPQATVVIVEREQTRNNPADIKECVQKGLIRQISGLLSYVMVRRIK